MVAGVVRDVERGQGETVCREVERAALGGDRVGQIAAEREVLVEGERAEVRVGGAGDQEDRAVEQ
ncbi:hypothetical protein GCM10022233_69860 [Streptomyces shaanxiensis]|uniref:Uncharacterized protein n=1 Tax=Streptomyces shaanxiensis TaxID=653357 RepID=A0ABP7W320_9ACTN